MIPKKIHYCWFGGKELPKKDRMCIETWKKYCPDYEIIEWNESNYDINNSEYMAAAYKEKKWGFIPDYARFDIIYREGGIYMDTDVELIKPLDELLENKGFMGFEGGMWINGGMGFGAEPGNLVMKTLRDMYNDFQFYYEDGSLNLTPSPFYITEQLVQMGLKKDDSMQDIDGVKIYPTEYFSPKNYETGKIKITPNTISVHHYNASWTSLGYRIKLRIARLIGTSKFEKLVDLKNKLK
ncbi:glycosyl transferase [Neobacillus sp. MER 74]|uniref:glycosyltransferase family 32 protein n=1 Tax=Neobacillus sp. MER 74 TaxID=2939566 RepID=UPI00203FEAB7|nr:glycosyltransferase [Neobacillus sp. MER 74]MCM3116041.1 glycosyl transferase [Neobacillus sp. MER 74]